MAKPSRVREPEPDEERLGPLCVRFPSRDLELATTLAAKDYLALSVWMREVVLARAARVVAGELCEPLVIEKPNGGSHQVCIRFRPHEWKTVHRACVKENALWSPWIRAEVRRRVDEAVVGGDVSATPSEVREARRRQSPETVGIDPVKGRRKTA
jgi:hypothetical protein